MSAARARSWSEAPKSAVTKSRRTICGRRRGDLPDRVVLSGNDGRLLISEPATTADTHAADDPVGEAWFTEDDGLILPADYLMGDGLHAADD